MQPYSCYRGFRPTISARVIALLSAPLAFLRKENFNGLLFAIVALMMSSIASSATKSMPAIGWIEVRPAAGGRDLIAVTAHALAMADTRGNFKLKIVRASRGNKSNSQQSGTFALAPGEAKALSSTTINVGIGDRLDLHLLLTVDGREAFSARLSNAYAK